MATKLMGAYGVPEGVEITGRYDEGFAGILTREALQFAADLQREFRGRVRYAMERRREAQRRYDAGGALGFDPAMRHIREGDWVCAPVPPAVADRSVEITGPVERKMVINALNSGAKVFMCSMARAEDWVLCRIFKKTRPARRGGVGGQGGSIARRSSLLPAALSATETSCVTEASDACGDEEERVTGLLGEGAAAGSSGELARASSGEPPPRGKLPRRAPSLRHCSLSSSSVPVREREIKG